ncbi:unnamed protein product [Cuscuta campestris]|uniref:Uncharacterized protein n=1 Tax=Cuscuta campestris TaxID=132261 RepID=A0A484KD50_9ASTE|nr:unnamed protein product [Cuscuta campestris]
MAAPIRNCSGTLAESRLGDGGSLATRLCAWLDDDCSVRGRQQLHAGRLSDPSDGDLLCASESGRRPVWIPAAARPLLLGGGGTWAVTTGCGGALTD